MGLKETSVRDPIHGFVRLDRFDFIGKIILTPEFQRLRFITQLGMSPLVYPSATHNRFSHSLGAMHIMERVLDHLVRTGDVKVDESDDLIKTGLAAALLHDIGHGPLSHSSEQWFGFKHEEITNAIIDMPPVSDILEKDGVEPSRVIRVLQRTTTSSSDILLSQLTSSELDVDRLDYLVRDSYFAGVGFGNVDLERIIDMLRICREGDLRNHAISLFKGRYSLESYILGRHLMYQAVYFHKTTRGAEKLVQSVFRRAVEAKSKAHLPENLEFLRSRTPPTVEDILSLDDHTVFDLLRKWQKNKDPVLSDLCKRLFNRRLLKAIELTPERQSRYLTGVQDKFLRLAKNNGIDASYFCPIDSWSEIPYNPYRIRSPDDQTTVTTNIFVLDENEKPAEISEVSDVVQAIAGRKYFDRLYMPSEIRQEAGRLFKSK